MNGVWTPRCSSRGVQGAERGRGPRGGPIMARTLTNWRWAALTRISLHESWRSGFPTLNSRSFLQLIFLWDCLRGVSLLQLLRPNLAHHTDTASRLIHHVFPRRREAARCERQQEALYNTKPTFSNRGRL